MSSLHFSKCTFFQLQSCLKWGLYWLPPHPPIHPLSTSLHSQLTHQRVNCVSPCDHPALCFSWVGRNGIFHCLRQDFSLDLNRASSIPVCASVPRCPYPTLNVSCRHVHDLLKWDALHLSTERAIHYSVFYFFVCLFVLNFKYALRSPVVGLCIDNLHESLLLTNNLSFSCPAS